MRNITVLTAIMLTVIMVPTGIYAIQNPKTAIDLNSAEEVALAYIRDGPTFSFDGITSTLKVMGIDTNKSNSPQYVVTINFVCLHGGYGDRTGKMVTQALTPHTAVVTVVEGKVVSAILDDNWNEAAQRPVTNDDAKPAIEAIALNWLINAPTFKFDGVVGSAKVTASFLAMTFAAPSFWGVTIEFDSLQAGYGDRSGEMLAQVITHHVANIHVTEGAVDFAVLDDVWDEVKQANVGEASANDKIVTIEEARDIIVNFIIAKYGLTGTLPAEWTVEDLIPQGLVGAQKTQYTFGGWVVTIENAVVWKPTYTVRVEKGSIAWSGEVDQNRDVIETEGPGPSVPALIYTPDIARKMCIDYLIWSRPEVGARMPVEWTETNIVPEGIVGLTKVQYTSGAYIITVSAPVVWKPTHTVTISYSGTDGAFTWEGIVPQGGPVQETSFQK